jgi:hypothetical protein
MIETEYVSIERTIKDVLHCTVPDAVSGGHKSPAFA